eukprot:TRINITY_DN5573_c0_g1_i1.p1 TRINITY_DN5573_c0_g1~~TRINITY_DN5573_c0_g1_i1.p1  ORF type:complete len:307 (+),score=58.46 TRINITY_DN5573_c0_g1_i1:38-922(+)
MKNCHIRDGAALVAWFAWLEEQLANGEEKHTEVTVADKLEEFRSKVDDYVSLSFETISGAGSNGAIIHYSPDKSDCAAVTKDSMFLCDSGGQYLDGTTDVTRTVHFGTPTAHQKRCFTRVLQGHIALGNAVFPEGTEGYKLDPLARMYLWEDGLDYRHGTGHGVGSFLNVHEGPHGISSGPRPGRIPLMPGMTITNEPGYYEDGNFGVRIENVMLVKKADTKFNFGEKEFYCFEHITIAPYQTKLIDVSVLSPAELDFINNYNAKCFTLLSPLLEKDARALAYLKRETQKLQNK